MINNIIEKITKIDINLLFAMTLSIVAVIFLLKAIFSLSSEFANYASHKKRLKQLRFNKKQPFNSHELLENVTDAMDTHLFSKHKPTDLKKIEKDLIMAGWDKNFTSLQFKAMATAFKIIALVMFLLLSPINIYISAFMALIPAFATEVLLKNDISRRKAEILNHFPELISVIQGYLEAGIPLIEAISYAIPFAGEAWGGLLTKVVLDAEINSIEFALDELKNRVDLLEVREFASLVKLAYIQGSNVIESFEAQSKRMEAIKYEVNQMKIQKRRSMGVIVQMPMLLMVFLAFGLPLYPQLTSILGAM